MPLRLGPRARAVTTRPSLRGFGVVQPWLCSPISATFYAPWALRTLPTCGPSQPGSTGSPPSTITPHLTFDISPLRSDVPGRPKSQGILSRDDDYRLGGFWAFEPRHISQRQEVSCSCTEAGRPSGHLFALPGVLVAEQAVRADTALAAAAVRAAMLTLALLHAAIYEAVHGRFQPLALAVATGGQAVQGA